MADALQNLQTRDAFDEVNKAEGMGTGNKVHIRVQQRNRRKCILTIQGLDDDLDLKKICKALRKNLQCNGAVVKDKEYGDIIQLQGDHRSVVQEFLVDQEIITKDQLVVHGFWKQVRVQRFFKDRSSQICPEIREDCIYCRGNRYYFKFTWQVWLMDGC